MAMLGEESARTRRKEERRVEERWWREEEGRWREEKGWKEGRDDRGIFDSLCRGKVGRVVAGEMPGLGGKKERTSPASSSCVQVQKPFQLQQASSLTCRLSHQNQPQFILSPLR